MLPFIRIHHSKSILFLAVAIYLVVILSVLASSFVIVIKLLLVALLGRYARGYFKRYVLQTASRSIIWLSKSYASFWTLKFVNQQIVNAYLMSNSLITPFLLVLNFYCEDRSKVTALITPESVGVKVYKQLLAELYHNRLSATL